MSITMKMAKASPQEIDDIMKLAHLTDQACHPRCFEHAQFPTDDDDPDYFDYDNPEHLHRFYERVKALSRGLMRVAYGYSILVDNCCDPAQDTLAWKPGIIVPKEQENQTEEVDNDNDKRT